MRYLTVAVGVLVLGSILTITHPKAQPNLSIAPSPIPEAPTERERVFVGMASWYSAGSWYTQNPRPGAKGRNQDGGPFEYYAAAGLEIRKVWRFRWGLRPIEVRITNLSTGVSIIATIVDTCGCRSNQKHRKIIDLSPAAFLALADGNFTLSRGVQEISVEILGRR